MISKILLKEATETTRKEKDRKEDKSLQSVSIEFSDFGEEKSLFFVALPTMKRSKDRGESN